MSFRFPGHYRNFVIGHKIIQYLRGSDFEKSDFAHSETALSHDLMEYIQYCDAISDLIKRYEIVQYQAGFYRF